MSAFMVSDRHIAYLVLAFRRYHARPGRGVTLFAAELAEMARMLKAACEASIVAAYPNNAEPCPSCGELVCNPRIGYDPRRPAEWTLPIPAPAGWRPGVPAPCPFAVVEMPPEDSLGITPIGTIKAAQCYVYQAIEAPTWEHSEAKRTMELLITEAISSLPGYEDAPWGIP